MLFSLNKIDSYIQHRDNYFIEFLRAVSNNFCWNTSVSVIFRGQWYNKVRQKHLIVQNWSTSVWRMIISSDCDLIWVSYLKTRWYRSSKTSEICTYNVLPCIFCVPILRNIWYFGSNNPFLPDPVTPGIWHGALGILTETVNQRVKSLKINT